MLNSILKVKDKVEYLLEINPIFRDDDNKLIARIWNSESKATSVKSFLLEFGQKKYTSPEAIRRARQKLQEHNPHLRGKLYNSRHNNGKDVKSGIKFMNF